MNHPTAQQQPSSATKRRELGARGEELAAHYLQSRGCRVLARNWRLGRRGELDLVVVERGVVVAVEVKTRSGLGYGHPFEAITGAKSRRLRELLHAWVREHRPGAHALRVDVIGITMQSGGSPRIEHLRGIA